MKSGVKSPAQDDKQPMKKPKHNDVDHASSDNNNNNNDNDRTSRLVRHLMTHTSWLDYNEDLEYFVQNVPKVELHVHLDGSFDQEYLWNYLQSHPELLTQCYPSTPVPLPWDPPKTLPVRQLVSNCQSLDGFHKLCTCRDKRSLKEMLNCFEIFLPLVKGNLQVIEELAYDFVKRQYEQNIIYTEVRYSPQLLAEGMTNPNNDTKEKEEQTNIVTGRMVLDCVTKGLRRGCNDFCFSNNNYTNIIINQILCGIAWRPDWANETVELAKEYRDKYPCAVVGIDIAAGEEHFDAAKFPQLHQPYYDMIQKAKEYNIPITLHAGEVTDETYVERAIDPTTYAAKRIGHGYKMMGHSKLIDEVCTRQIHVETCPTSSLETGGWIQPSQANWKDHPCVTLLEQENLSFSLNSDDPAVFHTSLSWQYRIAMAKMGFSIKDILQTIRHAIHAAFCSKEQKQTLLDVIQQFEKEYQEQASRKQNDANPHFQDRVRDPF